MSSPFKFDIKALSLDKEKALQEKIDLKTKPIGALGRLEEIAFQIASIQNTLSPDLNQPCMMVFAADHGLSDEGVSPYPKEVTTQMVLNFLNGGAAINVFSNLHQLQLKIINAGVAGELPPHKNLIQCSIAEGTRNSLHETAMSSTQLKDCFRHGRELILSQINTGCNVFLFGEMGIGNTSAASLIMSDICGLDLNECVGKGTGLDENGIQHKLTILKKVKSFHRSTVNPSHPFSLLECYGGFEIAMMTAAMLACAEHKKLFVVDGFIATSAFLVAHAQYSHVIDYAIFSHCSDEAGHKKMLNYLKATPLLQLDLRLGEGTGAAIAYPLIKSSVEFLNNMASFESASVSQRD